MVLIFFNLEYYFVCHVCDIVYKSDLLLMDIVVEIIELSILNSCRKDSLSSLVTIL